MSDPKIGLQLMGMKCWKCRKEMGAMCIPFDQSHTPETLRDYMKSYKVMPICESCINSNPRFISFENLQDKK